MDYFRQIDAWAIPFVGLAALDLGTTGVALALVIIRTYTSGEMGLFDSLLIWPSMMLHWTSWVVTLANGLAGLNSKYALLGVVVAVSCIAVDAPSLVGRLIWPPSVTPLFRVMFEICNIAWLAISGISLVAHLALEYRLKRWLLKLRLAADAFWLVADMPMGDALAEQVWIFPEQRARATMYALSIFDLVLAYAMVLMNILSITPTPAITPMHFISWIVVFNLTGPPDVYDGPPPPIPGITKVGAYAVFAGLFLLLMMGWDLGLSTWFLLQSIYYGKTYFVPICFMVFVAVDVLLMSLFFMVIDGMNRYAIDRGDLLTEMANSDQFKNVKVRSLLKLRHKKFKKGELKKE